MARRSSGKPWFHEKSGYWCSTVSGNRVYLDKDYKLACRKLRERLAEARRAEQGVEKDWLDKPLSNLVEEFLEDIKARKKPGTFEGYRYRLLRALRIVPPKTKVGEVGKIHLSKIEQRMTGKYSPSTIKDTIATLQAVFAWALKHDLIATNTLAGFEKPTARKRNRTITDDEFNALLDVSDEKFSDVLISLRLTGCRPAEIRSLRWSWVDLDDGTWTFPDHKTITQQRNPTPRCVPIPEEVVAICRKLAEKPHKQSDHVFLNSQGKPFTKDALVQRMGRARERAGIEVKAGEQLVLYCNRHSFATGAAGQISDIELANLLGHTDVRTTQRYVHLSKERLKEIRSRVDQRVPERT